ncbi:hypothetical protein KKH07_01260 [Patescibacteria group bacterium]|nr:hypothetical protein [Patescibacteria group bacterium]MBU1563706.1 hypothetical protein [Patescibacteria group bacterium]MBU2068169.1 hypothetical protein [Patescibacteria group bacterium]
MDTEGMRRHTDKNLKKIILGNSNEEMVETAQMILDERKSRLEIPVKEQERRQSNEKN